MALWKSKKNQYSLEILSENISGRFSKETGDYSSQGTNSLIVYRNESTGEERTIVAEEVTVSEDSRYVYFRTRGRTVESAQQISRRRKNQQRKEKIQVG